MSPRQPWTVRVAGWSARHRWPVVALWIVATVGLFVVSLAAGGTRSGDAVSVDGSDSAYESIRAYDVFDAAGPPEDPADASQGFTLVIAVGSGTVDDPLLAPAQAGVVSADRTAARIPARLLGEGDAIDQRIAPIADALDDIRADHPSLDIHALNSRMANDEIQELVNGGLDASLRLTIPLTFMILIVAFGAVVAAAVPLIMATTSLLAAFGFLALYTQVVAPASPYASQLVVLIGLAVAVDYSLFMITRFRTERRHGRDKLAAIDIASATAGRAVFFSGLAVMVSIAGLFLLDDVLFRSMAVGTIGVVFVAVVGSLTFLPATLAILGDSVNRLRVPIIGRDRSEGSGPWATVVRAVMRRPFIAAVLTAAVLLGMASPALRLRMGQADFASFPDSLDSVQAVNILNAKWPTDTTVTMDVVVTRADEPATMTAIDAFSKRVQAFDGVAGPPETKPSTDGHVALISFHLAGGSNDEHNRAIVRQTRADLVPAAFGGLGGVEALVTGDVAFTLDVVDFYSDGIPLVIAFVLTLSFGLLLVAFRSIVIPIKAILLNLLSTGAAFGALVFVFQDGHGADLLGFKPGPIESFVPVFIFTILFGLSMDYHVFILTRIKEARDHGLSSNEAVARGISITSGTITSAAAIMVVVFAVFVTLELTIIKQLGFGLAVAIFLDATVVRSVLLPATMRLLGEWNWWLPSWLAWLPHVAIEGASVDDDSPPGAQP